MTTIRTDILGARISIGPKGNTPDDERATGRIRALSFDPGTGFVMAVVLDDGALVEAGLPGIGGDAEVGAIKVLTEEPKSVVTPRELQLEVMLLTFGTAAAQLVRATPAAVDASAVTACLEHAAKLLGTKAW